MSLAPGEQFGRYTIEALLGEGGMGAVYQAWDTRLHRKVALKVLHQSAASSGDSQGVARMLREARAAAALNHPNVVAIFDVGEENGAPFLVMELIEGKSLRKFIGADVPLSTHIRWLLEIARALGTAHHAGLVHRDVKPENVMLRDDGVLKMLDFGIAKRAALSVDAHGQTLPAELATLTGRGMIVGTVAYMAPEQVRGEDLDGRADQFAWGVLAQELLTGKLPFGDGKDALGILASMLSKEAPPLQGVPEPLSMAVRRALSKAREDRFASMDEIVALLEPITTGQVSAESLRQLPPPSSRAAAPPFDSSTAQVQVLSGARRRGRWPLAVGAIALLGAGLAVALLRHFAEPKALPGAAVSASAPSAAVPTPVTELALPKTQSAEALAAYREGLQGFRDAAWSVSHAAFLRAIKLDPTFAAAYLRLAQTSVWFGTVSEAREAFRKAISLRSSLGERELSLLHALEPTLRGDPPDPWETAKRLESAARQYSMDAEFAAMAALFNVELSPVTLLEFSERCLALDPLSAECMQLKARGLARLERTSDALAAFDHCLKVSPAAEDCVWDRAQLYTRTGQCALVEQDARHGIAGELASGAYRRLANALHALGRPLSGVGAALAQAQALDPESQKAHLALIDEIQLALISGRMDDAERAALKLHQEVAAAGAEEAHIEPAKVLVAILLEMGREAQARTVAEEFLAQRDAWTKSLFPSIWNDPTMPFLKTKLRAGAISRQEYAASRSTWIQTWESRLPQDMRGAAWIVAYALPANTAEDAQEALAVHPNLMPALYYSYSAPGIEGMVGKVYLLAGRADQALPYLTRAAADCSALSDPIGHTIAQYHLGRALEARGDKAAACAAYKVVLDRWSPAKSSVTAKAAAEQSKALRCAGSP